jgi:hypothetical protein
MRMAVNRPAIIVNSFTHVSVFCAFLSGTSLGIALSSTLGSSWSALLPVFATLSCVHLTCNYLSLGHVSLNTINTERFELILREFDATGRVPLPTQVAGQSPSLALMHLHPDRPSLTRPIR